MQPSPSSRVRYPPWLHRGIVVTLIALGVATGWTRIRPGALTEAILPGIAIRLESFYKSHGRFPSAKEGLGALLDDPRPVNTVERYEMPQTSLRDEWLRPILYRPQGLDSYDLISLGLDHSVGGEGVDRDLVLECRNHVIGEVARRPGPDTTDVDANG